MRVMLAMRIMQVFVGNVGNYCLASFPGLLHLQFLIACSMLQHAGSNQKLGNVGNAGNAGNE